MRYESVRYRRNNSANSNFDEGTDIICSTIGTEISLYAL